MASADTDPIDLDLNHDAPDQTLTLIEPQNSIFIEEKQVGNQGPGISIYKQSEVVPNRDDLLLAESEKGLEMEDNTWMGEERKVGQSKDWDLVADSCFLGVNEEVEGFSDHRDSVDMKSDVWNLENGVLFNDAPPTVRNEDGAVETRSSRFGAGLSYSDDGRTSVIGCSPKKEDLATVKLDSVVGDSVSKASEECGDTDASVKKECQDNYSLPQEDGVFVVSDLVWGKIRNHPWRPGQIFDPLDSSERATKNKKKDGILVAYFGDQSFAWCDISQLKPFYTYFSEMERQSASEAFLNAVNCALDEVSRRVELGLFCSCVPEEICTKVKYQKVENAGIREGATNMSSDDMPVYEPGRLLEYVKELALLPSGGLQRLELVIAKAQIMSFYRSKGYLALPAFHVHGGLVENDSGLSPGSKPLCIDSGEQMNTGDQPSHRCKKIPEDGLHHKRKRKSVAELMCGNKASDIVDGTKSSSYTDGKAAVNLGSLSSGKKLKAVDTFTGDSGQRRATRRPSISGPDTKDLTEKRSSIVGDRIRRVADHLTGSPPMIKTRGERFQNDSAKVDSRIEKVVHPSGSLRTPKGTLKRAGTPKEYSSPNELLSQLCLAARDPMKGYSFLAVIISFFTDFRDSFHQKHFGSGKKIGSGKTSRGKLSKSKMASAESLELNAMDSYRTDKIIHGSSKKVQKRRGRIPYEYSSPDVLLSQLCWAALDPIKGYSFLAIVVSFFSDFRNSFHQKPSSSGKTIGSYKTGRRKSSNSKTGSVDESFELNDMKDSYWTDRIMHGITEEEPSQESRKRKGESLLDSPNKQGKDATEHIKHVSEVPGPLGLINNL